MWLLLSAAKSSSEAETELSRASCLLEQKARGQWTNQTDALCPSALRLVLSCPVTVSGGDMCTPTKSLPSSFQSSFPVHPPFLRSLLPLFLLFYFLLTPRQCLAPHVVCPDNFSSVCILVTPLSRRPSPCPCLPVCLL